MRSGRCGPQAADHERISLGSPYSRAAEHSAQQAAERLHRYEAAFKASEINISCCSTAMEMGVDIGSVSSVMHTNVLPSITNYKQRVGRAGRGHGFSMSLTYPRDMPLDMEAFRKPVRYLTRHIEAPKVKLDSRRIVQRHVNALLLAAWFKQASGEAMKMKAGDFFGCSPAIGAKRAELPPVTEFKEWLLLPSTMQDLSSAVEVLVRASILANNGGVYRAAKGAIEGAGTMRARTRASGTSFGGPRRADTSKPHTSSVSCPGNSRCSSKAVIM